MLTVSAILSVVCEDNFSPLEIQAEAMDSSGREHNCQIKGAQLVDGKYKGALQFDGVEYERFCPRSSQREGLPSYGEASKTMNDDTASAVLDINIYHIACSCFAYFRGSEDLHG